MRTASISGMRDGYEDMCQKMLWRGVAYLAEAKPPVEMWEQAKQNPQIVGVLITEGDDLKGLEEAIIKPDEDVTGAMHQSVMNHLAFIHQNGTEEWLKHLEPHRQEPGDMFEWNGDLH